MSLNVLVQEGFFIRKWSKFILPNNEVVALVDISENSILGKLFYATSWAGSSGLKDRRVDTADLNQLWEQGLDILPFKGENNLTAFTGNKPEDFLKFNNAFEGVLEGKLANQMIAFALSGGTDTNLLPRFPGIPYPVFFTYRIDFGTK